MLKKPPLVSDTGIISRYGLINRFDILQELYSGNIILPTEVIVECIRVPMLQSCIQDALTYKWIEEFKINYVDHPNIMLDYAKLSKKFGPGESAVMAIAKNKGWTVGSDDMRATAKYCSKNSIPLLGSLGILYDAYDKELVNEKEGQAILNDMISLTRYKSPVSDFQRVIDWFKEGKGRELF